MSAREKVPRVKVEEKKIELKKEEELEPIEIDATNTVNPAD